jgi:MFS family permease
MLSRHFLARLDKTVVIYPAALLQSVAFGTISLGFVFHLRTALGLEPATIGLFLSFTHVCYLVACLTLSRVLARVLPRRAMFVSSAACALLAVAMVASPWLPLVFVLCGAFGAIQALFWPPVVGWLSTGTEGAALGRAVARFNIAWSIGAIASPWVGGSLSEIAGSVAMLFGGAASAVVAALLAAASRLLPSVRDDRHTESRVESVEGAEDRSTPVRFPAWVGVAVAWLLMGVLFSAFPIYATEQLGFTRTFVDTLLLMRALFAAVVFGAMGRWSFWQFRGTPMVVAQVLLAAAAAGLALARSPLAVGATLCAVGMLGAVAYVESVFHGVAGSLQRARRMAIHEALLTVGALGGALVGGWFYQARGMPFVLVSYSLLLFATAGLQVAMVAPLRRARVAGSVSPGRRPAASDPGASSRARR